MTPADRQLVAELRQLCGEGTRGAQLADTLGRRVEDLADQLVELASLAAEVRRLQEAYWRGRHPNEAAKGRSLAAAREMEARLGRELERLGFSAQVGLPGLLR